MIRVDAVWLAVEPLDMRAGTDTALTRRGREREARLHAWWVTVERHIRGKWTCAKCETLVQAPVPAQ